MYKLRIKLAMLCGKNALNAMRRYLKTKNDLWLEVFVRSMTWMYDVAPADCKDELRDIITRYCNESIEKLSHWEP